jgi:hypothetical protein
MRALVISGGGSKGAFGGGVAQYLLQEKEYKYDIPIILLNEKEIIHKYMILKYYMIHYLKELCLIS